MLFVKFQTPRDLNSLVRTNGTIYEILNTYLYRSIIQNDEKNRKNWRGRKWLVNWAIVCAGRVPTLLKVLGEGVKIPSLTSAHGYYYVRRAVFQGHIDMVQFLLEREREVLGYQAYGYKKTLLSIASKQGHINIILMLMEGSDRSMVEIVLKEAVLCGRLPLVEYAWPLLRELIVANPGETRIEVVEDLLFTKALEYGQCAIAEYLVRNGSFFHVDDREVKRVRGLNLLLIAAKQGNREIIRFLLDNGADPSPDIHPNGLILLVNAVHNQKEPVVIMQLLLDRCPTLSQQLPDALVEAARIGPESTQVVDFILSTGIDPNWRDSFGHTALEYACLNNYVSSVESLLTAGADPSLQHDGRTPIDFATEQPVQGVIRQYMSFWDDSRDLERTALEP
ncbi:ankyrin [Aspergillus sclerotiicarbonarius CBS 121057]|uniref:Ankyrin n=1 Tax=Aspergillus sclerotiicarbonarius (strain CBS 121057 / IBT 28362) TaxID=1448318 RepID=A0A319E3Z0_ASPSB|nr:ankyrin [Aspergillus sclerotiicarbonarius CBS 121057]